MRKIISILLAAAIISPSVPICGRVNAAAADEEAAGIIAVQDEKTEYSELRTEDLYSGVSPYGGLTFSSAIKPSYAQALYGENQDIYSLIEDVEDNETTIDISGLYDGDEVVGYRVTTATENGQEILSYEADKNELSDKTITVETWNADWVEISLIFEVDLEEEISVPAGRYNITAKVNNNNRTDLYANEQLVFNNLNQQSAFSGVDRILPSQAEYTAGDIVISESSVTFTERDLRYNSDYQTVEKVRFYREPEITERARRVYVLGDSLAAKYYEEAEAGQEPYVQTGWGDVLENYLKDNVNITNIAQSGEYTTSMLKTSFTQVSESAQEGDILLIECGYNDRMYATSDEMISNIQTMTEIAQEKGMEVFVVTPNASLHDYRSSVSWSSYAIQTAEESGVNVIDLSAESYQFLNSRYGDMSDDERAALLKQYYHNESDTLHSNNNAANCWAEIVAQNLYENASTRALVNTYYEYTFNDGISDITVKVHEQEYEPISGICGDNLTWTITEDGTLTISGTGDMWDWEDGDKSPWFIYRFDINKIVIEDGVTSIGRYGFRYLVRAEEVEIPESVTKIDYYAFEDCRALIEVNIPKSVEYIGNYAFLGAFSLQNIYVDPENSKYYSIDGVFAEGNVLMAYPEGRKDKEYVVPDGIKELGADVFYRTYALEKVTIPDTVTKISMYAFVYCTRLKTVEIPASVQTVSRNAFGNCESLEKAVVFNANTQFAENVFDSGSSKLTLYGYAGSSAETYAEKNNIAFETIYNSKDSSASFIFGSRDAKTGEIKIDAGDEYSDRYSCGFSDTDGLTAYDDGISGTDDYTFKIKVSNGNYKIAVDTTSDTIISECVDCIPSSTGITKSGGSFEVAVCDGILDLTFIGGSTLSSLAITKKSRPSANAKPALYAIGDSTVNNTAFGAKSWGNCVGNGAILPDTFSAFSNNGMAGRDSVNFYNQGRVESVLLAICPGDYVTVNMGINSRETGEMDSFETLMENYYVNGILQRGGIPVILTATPDGPVGTYADWNYSDGVFSCDRGDSARNSTLREIASRQNLNVIDVGAWGNEYFNSLTEDDVTAYNSDNGTSFTSVLELVQSWYIDHNHYTEYLGNKIAEFILSSLSDIYESNKSYVFYEQDYEKETDNSSWSAMVSDALKLVENDADHGKYISYDFTDLSSNSRTAATSFAAGTEDEDYYVMELDIALKSASTYGTEFMVTDDNFYYLNSRVIYDNENYIFKLTSIDSSTWILNDIESNAVKLTANEWYHYKLVVDKNRKNVTVTITDNKGNKITENNVCRIHGQKADAAGLYCISGRYYPVMKVDNILIREKTVNDLIGDTSDEALESAVFSEKLDKRITVLSDSLPQYLPIKLNVSGIYGSDLGSDAAVEWSVVGNEAFTDSVSLTAQPGEGNGIRGVSPSGDSAYLNVTKDAAGCIGYVSARVTYNGAAVELKTAFAVIDGENEQKYIIPGNSYPVSMSGYSDSLVGYNSDAMDYKVGDLVLDNWSIYGSNANRRLTLESDADGTKYMRFTSNNTNNGSTVGSHPLSDQESEYTVEMKVRFAGGNYEFGHYVNTPNTGYSDPNWTFTYDNGKLTAGDKSISGINANKWYKIFVTADESNGIYGVYVTDENGAEVGSIDELPLAETASDAQKYFCFVFGRSVNYPVDIAEFSVYKSNKMAPEINSCGDNLVWSLDRDGTLTISGTGEMYNWDDFSSVPWYQYKDSIKSVVINGGVETIGDNAFWYSNLTDVTIKGNLTAIGDFAFAGCNNLESIGIPDSVESIGEYAFSKNGLISITIPGSAKDIKSAAFSDCIGLTNVFIPDSVTYIDEYAFYGCDSITDAFYGGTQDEWEAVTIGDNNEPLTNAEIHFDDAEEYTGLGSPAVTYSLNADWKFKKSSEVTGLNIPFSLSDAAEADKKDGKLFYEVDYDDSDWEEVSVPHSVNAIDSFDGICGDAGEASLYRGFMFYRKHVTVPETDAGKKLFLEFETVRQSIYLYVNGEMVGYYEAGIAPAGFDITEYINVGQDNVIAVATDNAASRGLLIGDGFGTRETKPGGEPGDQSGSPYQWNTKDFNPAQGGITGNVNLYAKGKIYQTLPLYNNLKTTGNYIYGTNYNIAAKSATINVEAEVRNETSADADLTLRVDVVDMDGNTKYSFSETGKAKKASDAGIIYKSMVPDDAYDYETTEKNSPDLRTVDVSYITASFDAKNIRFWSDKDPYLYTVYTYLEDEDGNIIDAQTAVTGFRKVKYTLEGGLRINDKTTYLKGYAQASTNEWAVIGAANDWLTDYDMWLVKESNANFIRWMHVAPKPSAVRSSDKYGVIVVCPAGDKEMDVTGRQWDQRTEAMRDAVIYFRNSPSVMFWEGGNYALTPGHMRAMSEIRKNFDPNGGRFTGARSISSEDQIEAADYVGTMYNRNASAAKSSMNTLNKYVPIIESEYAREEAPRRVWDDFSPPDYDYDNKWLGDGAIRQDGYDIWDLTSEDLAVSDAKNYEEFWKGRVTGKGDNLYAGAAMLLWSDSNMHNRNTATENSRTSGKVDPVRIKKQAFYALQAVQSDMPAIHIVGHWSYPEYIKGDTENSNYWYEDKTFNGTYWAKNGTLLQRDPTKKTVYVIGSPDIAKVELYVNGEIVGTDDEPDNSFVYAFKNIDVTQSGKVTAKAYDKLGIECAENELITAGEPAGIMLKPVTSPNGLMADGSDIMYVDIEIVDEDGNICPLSYDKIDLTLTGEGVLLGGYNSGVGDKLTTNAVEKTSSGYEGYTYAECGVNRVFIRSTRNAGEITLSAKINGLPEWNVQIYSADFDNSVEGGTGLTNISVTPVENSDITPIPGPTAAPTATPIPESTPTPTVDPTPAPTPTHTATVVPTPTPTAVPAPTPRNSGTCGSGVTWELDRDGTLNIKGTGKMTDWEYYGQMPPWYSSNYAIKTINIGEGVTHIGGFAFYNCSEVTSVTIPVSVTSVFYSAFNGCTSLADVYYGGTEEEWDAISIVSANYELTRATRHYASAPTPTLTPTAVPTSAPTSIPTATPIIMDTPAPALTPAPPSEPIETPAPTAAPTPKPQHTSGVTGGCTWVYNNGVLTVSGTGELPDYEKENTPWYHLADKITSVAIGEGVTAIGNNAFYNLTKAAAVNIPSTVRAIGSGVFENCDALKSVTLTDNMSGGIGDSAFKNCGSLKTLTVPDSVTNIGEGAFEGCTLLRQISLPFIGSQRGTGNTRDVFSYIFGGNVPRSLEAVTITNETDVPENAFKGLSDIETITLNSNVSSIGNGAFDGCSSLTQFTMPQNIRLIGDYTFRGCESAISITVPDTVMSIGEAAFDGCKKLQTVNIPNGVEYLYANTFRGCASLREIEIPTSVAGIGEGVLAGCNKLISIKVPFVGANTDPQSEGDPNKCVFGYLFGETNNAQIPPSVTKVEITSTSRDGYIPKEAFKNCGNIEDIIIDGGRTISDSAFENCKLLKNLYIPQSVSNMGEGILVGCTRLETLTIPFIGKNRSDAGTETSVLGGFFGYDDTDLRGTIQYYNDRNYHVYKVPKTLKNVSVLNHTNIPEGAFMECDYLEKVVIVTGATMNAKAFYHCASLKSVTLPNDLQTIGSQAFAECESLGTINIPTRVRTIGEQVFYNCRNLINVTIPDSVTEIADDVFIGTNLFSEVNLLADKGMITCSLNSEAYRYAMAHNIATNVVDSSELEIKKTAATITLLSDNSYLVDVIDAYNMRGTLHVVLYDVDGSVISEETRDASEVEYRIAIPGAEMAKASDVKIYIESEGDKVSTEDETLSAENGDIPELREGIIEMSYENGKVSLTGSGIIKTGTVLIEAVYNGDMLDKVNLYPVTSVNETIDVSNDLEDGSAKYMLWSSLEKMQPLADVITN